MITIQLLPANGCGFRSSDELYQALRSQFSGAWYIRGFLKKERVIVQVDGVSCVITPKICRNGDLTLRFESTACHADEPNLEAVEEILRIFTEYGYTKMEDSR